VNASAATGSTCAVKDSTCFACRKISHCYLKYKQVVASNPGSRASGAVAAQQPHNLQGGIRKDTGTQFVRRCLKSTRTEI
jgi:hypothetical protein